VHGLFCVLVWLFGFSVGEPVRDFGRPAACSKSVSSLPLTNQNFPRGFFAIYHFGCGVVVGMAKSTPHCGVLTIWEQAIQGFYFHL
jgi:hypothetical protein